jgi:hypothetical protein
MKNLEISKNFGTGLENIVTNNFHSMGNVSASSNHFSNPVFSPYTNNQIGTLEKSYSGQETFRANYEIGQGTPVFRKY